MLSLSGVNEKSDFQRHQTWFARIWMSETAAFSPFASITGTVNVGRLLSSPHMLTISNGIARNGKYPTEPGTT